MGFDTDEYLYINLNDMGFVDEIKGKTKARNFRKQIEKLKELTK